jgi:hypothetical protein
MSQNGIERSGLPPIADLEAAQRLKVDLMTDGLFVSPETKAILVENDDIPLTLADYASTSGITLKLPNDTWVNAPISEFNPNFVETPANSLAVEDGKLFVVNSDGAYEAEFIPVPAYHDKSLKDGSPVKWIAITHSDRVRLSPIKGCAIQCDFCDIPFDKSPDEPAYRGQKVIGNILEAAGVALQDPILPAQHVLLSGGTPRKRDYGYENEVYERVVTENPDIDVDIMMVPMPGLLNIKRLGEIGVHGLSINIELWNKDVALRTMRSKAKASRELYLDFIEKASEQFGNGRVRSLLMVGIEPMEDTLKGVEALAERGCDPVLSPFRPDPVTPMHDMKPSTANELLEVWQRSQEIVGRYEGVKLGPRCVPCMHNTLTFADNSGDYYHSQQGLPRRDINQNDKV